MLQRRTFVLAAPLLGATALSHAHHGWSSFDQARPLYLEGRAVNVVWRDPHAELDLDVTPDLKLPAGLAQRTVPAQAAAVDGAGPLKAAQLPTRRDRRWHIELAPLSRMEACKVPEIHNGDGVALLGFTFAGEKGDPVLRVKYLLLDGKAYRLRSSPA